MKRNKGILRELCQLTDREKQQCRDWMNERFGSQLAHRRRCMALQLAMYISEQDWEDLRDEY